MGSIWGRSGSDLGSIWGRSGIDLGRFGVDLGSIWYRSGSIWCPSGIDLGSIWGRSGVVLELIWGRSGTGPGSIWCRSGVGQGSIMESIWGQSYHYPVYSGLIRKNFWGKKGSHDRTPQETLVVASAAAGSDVLAALCQAASCASSFVLSRLLGPKHHVPWLEPPR